MTVSSDSSQMHDGIYTVGKLDNPKAVVSIPKLSKLRVLDGLTDGEDSRYLLFGVRTPVRNTTHPSGLIDVMHTNVGENTSRGRRELYKKTCKQHQHKS